MKQRLPIDVAGSGAIILGQDITCDGFRADYQTRIQTHVHDDHMREFDTSKGYQNIYMTEPTRELLIAEKNADLIIRDNIIGVAAGTPFNVGDSTVTLLKNHHMLGSSQVRAELGDGTVVGYSSDFQWPSDTIMEVDYLVLDSTNGYPECVREYTQTEAEAQLVDLVCSKIRGGPVHIQGYRGTLQRGLTALSDQVDIPFLGSASLCRQVQVYRRYGYAIKQLLDIRSSEGRAALKDGRFVRFYGKGDSVPTDLSGQTSIWLSAFMTGRERALLERSATSFSVALSDHADFPGIIEYVRSTRARTIVCDNTRAGHAIDLARALCNLGMDARPSTLEPTLEWGA